MNLETENRKKRKYKPLTSLEWLTFFFFPFRRYNNWDFDTPDAFNEDEEERFKSFGFEKN